MQCVPHCMPRSFNEGSLACQHIKLIHPSIGRCIIRIMPAWSIAFPGITNRVTYNPFCYYKGNFDLSVVVTFKLSGPLTHAACFGVADFHICLDSSTS